MRVMFSSTSGDGHLNPMLPLASALREAGHDVAFAMAPEYQGQIARHGFEHLTAGIGLGELNRRTFLPHDITAELPVELQIFVGRFALGDAPDRVPVLRDLIATWHPDVIVSEPCDLAAPIAAAAASRPFVLHSFGRPMPMEYYEAAAPAVQALWASAGLDLPGACGVYGGTYIDICPTSLHTGGVPVGPTVHRLRPCSPAESSEAPAWLMAMAEGSLVYVTLGTIFNNIDRFRPILEGLAEHDGSVLVTIGKGNDPDALGLLPSNIRVERFLPQQHVLPHTDVMVAHAGSGSMLAAFSYGVPQLMLPSGADQFLNAEVSVGRGLARVLMPGEVTASRVENLVRELLIDTDIRGAAKSVATEITSMPSPTHVAKQLLSHIVPPP